MWVTILTTVVTILTALVTVVVTFILTRRREHENEWKRLKFSLYQEFILSLSGIVEGRDTPEAHLRYADAVNGMNLAASVQVLRSLHDFLDYNAGKKLPKNIEEHDRLLNILIRTMRADMFIRGAKDIGNFQFRLITTPKFDL